MSLTLPDTIAAMAKAGDFWALNQLAHMHEKALALHARNATVGAFTMEREDVAQEAFVGMTLLLKSWVPGSGSSFYSWMFTWLPLHLRRIKDASDFIVRIPAGRGVKDRREGNQALPFSTSLYAPAPDTDADDQLLDEVENYNRPSITDEDRMDLERVMTGCLTERQQRVIRLSLAGYSSTEIAETDGLTPQAVSSMYRAAVARMRRFAEGTVNPL